LLSDIAITLLRVPRDILVLPALPNTSGFPKVAVRPCPHKRVWPDAPLIEGRLLGAVCLSVSLPSLARGSLVARRWAEGIARGFALRVIQEKD